MKKNIYTLIRLASITGVIAISNSASSQISGAIFRDINNDGIRQTTNPIEPWEYGVVVKAYDGGNTLIGTSTSNVNGIYSFSAAQAPAGLAVRLEFILNSGDQPSKRIANNRSNVQFVVAGASAVNINFAIASKKLFSNNSNPWVATSAYTNGDALATGAGNAGDYDNVHVFPYDMSNNGGSTRRTKNQYTGSVFGLAWQKESRILFMSAFLKRHAGFGPNGIGAIYQTQIDAAGIPSTPKLLVDVTTIGINVGTNPRTSTLPANASTPNTDDGVFAEVGKRGIGGIELSNDGRELYIINMFEKKLQRINIGNPLKASFSAADVTGSWVIPNPNLPGTQWHPMALKMKNNKFYIGGICTRETTVAANIAVDTVNLRGVVYEFDPVTNVFTEVLRFPLSYRRGFTNNDFRYEFRNNYWNAWQNSGDVSIGGPLRTGLIGSTTGTNATGIYYPQPMFSAIEFDADGSMIIGIRDRFGDQAGYSNLFETGNVAGEKYRALTSGEVLRAGKTGSVWTFENGASVTTNGVTTTTPGVTSNNPLQLGSFPLQLLTPWGGSYGPGGGYYYYNFNFSLTGVPAPFNSGAAFTSHYLKSNGGLAYLPGYNEVMTTAIDPLSTAYANGIIKNVNQGAQAGNMSARMELFVSAANDPAKNGKAAALGDIEILLDAAAMEIGNRVWDDANANGIQDAHEDGIAGVKVVLRSPGADGIYDNGDDETWTVATDAEGYYYFDATVVNDSRRPATWLGVSATNSGVLPGFEYRVDLNALQPALAPYHHYSATNPGVSDNINSDATTFVNNTIEHVVNPGGSTAAGSVFENNYNIDFGFSLDILSAQQVDLKAVLDDKTVHVAWSTVGESEVKQYHIERSVDGKNFTEIGVTLSKGTGDFIYGKDDNVESITSPTVYYRLHIEDVNKQFKYTAIVKVNLDKDIKVLVAPNPFSDHLNLQVNSTTREQADVKIFNIIGQSVYSKGVMMEKGINSISLDDVSKLPSGTYMINVKVGDRSLKQKLVKY